MRPVIIALLCLAACSTGEDEYGSPSDIDLVTLRNLEKVMRAHEADPHGTEVCHHGCPVEVPAGPETWPWNETTRRRKQPLPCPRWMASRLLDRARPGGDGTGGVPAAGEFPSHAVPAKDESEDQEDGDGAFCWWEPVTQLGFRLRTALDPAEVRSLAGPLYPVRKPKRPAARDGFLVPEGYWQVFSVLSGSGLRTLALMTERNAGHGNALCRHIVTIDAIEARTGLDLFPLAPDDAFEAAPGDLAAEAGC